MGVPVRIVLYANGESAAREAARAAFERVAALDEIMSDYRPRSEVSLLPERPRVWQRASPDLVRVLSRAREVALWSHGAFDVTIGPLVDLWRRSRRTLTLPDAGELAAARRRVGWRMLEVDTSRSEVRLSGDNMRLDLGGVAKGYILQEALSVLREHGAESAMVEGGGDIVVGAAPPGRAGWAVDIEGADSAALELARALVNVAVATSGSAEQYVEIGGKRYSHVVDPRTGLGVTGTHQVTVMARDGATADALATALSVLGPGSEGAWSGHVVAVVWPKAGRAR